MARAKWVAGFLVALSAQAAPSSLLVRRLAGAEVDWSAGTVTASAGAAADIRMPSAESARPGAERRARVAAMETLRAALRALVVRHQERLGEKEIEAALGHVTTERIEYQSNGGVVLWVQVRFDDLTGKPGEPAVASRTPVAAPTAATVVLTVGAMELEVRPVVVAGGKEVVVRYGRYRQGQAPRDAISVRRDDKGRLVLPKGSGVALEQLAGGPVVIYLQRVVP